jgi:hypothetical protein
MIYRPSLFPNPRNTTDTWKNWCAKNGVKEPLLLMSQAFQSPNEYFTPDSCGFDFAFEFPPHKGTSFKESELKNYTNSDFFNTENLNNVVYDYESASVAWMNKNPYNFKCMKTVFPAWDNSSRRIHGNASIYAKSSPDAYGRWLEFCLKTSEVNDFIFINAWNEWAEGAYLEPDSLFGYAYLEQTYETLKKFHQI